MCNKIVLITCLLCMAGAARDRTATRGATISATGCMQRAPGSAGNASRVSTESTQESRPRSLDQWPRIVEEVNEWLGRGPPYKRSWKTYVRNRGSADFDPKSHDASFLSDFLSDAAKGMIPVDEEKPSGSTFSEDDNYETVLANMRAVSSERRKAAEKRIQVYTKVPSLGSPKFTFKYGDEGLKELRDGWSDFILETFRNDGTWANEFDDPAEFNEEKVKEKKEKNGMRAMNTPAYPGAMSTKSAERLFKILGKTADKYLWQEGDNSYTLVHTWPVNYDERYKKEFDCQPATDDIIELENQEDPLRMMAEKAALANFKKTVSLLLSKSYEIDRQPIDWDPKLDNFFERCVKGRGRVRFQSEMAFVGFPHDIATLVKAHPTLFPVRNLSQSEVQKTANEFSPERGVFITHVVHFQEHVSQSTRFRYRKIRYAGGKFTVEERRDFKLFGDFDGDEYDKVVLYVKRDVGDAGYTFSVVKPITELWRENAKLNEGVRLDDASLWKKFREQDAKYLAYLKKRSEEAARPGRRMSILPGFLIVIGVLVAMLIAMAVVLSAFFAHAARN